MRGDLDAIVGKALRKNPHERYATAAALAEVEYIDYLSYTSNLHAYRGDVKTAYALAKLENELLEQNGWQDSYAAVHARNNLVTATASANALAPIRR